ncbi:MAG: response regulator [Planctomycetes bacterium]|nr:response regulator [Planctomycetota bacterium]
MRAPDLLIVEDSAATRRFYADAMRREGFTAREVASAGEAVAAATARLPDVVLLDLLLPDAEGSEAARLLRSVPGMQEVPIVAITGWYPMIEDPAQFPAGVDAFLVKPVGAEHLVETLRAHLPPAPGVASPCRGSGLVLLVEEDPVQRRLGVQHLAHAGFEVVAVAGGAAALAAARARPPALVVAHVAAAGADGFELCLALRLDPALAATPVLLLTPVADGADAEAARQVGASALVVRGGGYPRLVTEACALTERGWTPPPVETTLAAVREERERRLLRQLDRQVTINAALAQRCRNQARQLVMLDVVAETLARAADVDAALRELLTRSLEASGVSKGAVFRVDPEARLALTERAGFDAAQEADLAQAFGRLDLLEAVVREERAMVLAPDGGRAADELLARAGVTSALLVPLVGGGLRLGVLFLGSDLADITRQDLLAFGRALGAYMGQALALAATFSRLAEAERRNEFLGVLAHELRGPLTPIVTGVELMRRHEADLPKVARYREMIRRQASHLRRLVDDLLDAARLTHGKLQLALERLDLSELCREVAEDRRPTFEAAAVTLTVTTPPGPVLVSGDRTRLVQVVGNLLANAAKFTRAGGTVSVEVAADDERARVAVRDTGVGIAPDVLQRLFLPFAQAEQSLARSEGGLGLGLTVVKGLVELHGGEVSATSEGEGRGAEFVVSVPLAAEDERRRASSGRLPHGRAAGLQVLLVEDSIDAAEVLKDLLELSGHRVTLAHTGPEGLEAARRLVPDVVVCDIGLPGLDGYELARTLRADPATREVALLALSGYGDPDHADRVTAAGFDRALTKPVQADELLRALQALAGA